MKNYLRIARLDHWFKNALILPGTIIAAILVNIPITGFWFPLLIGILSACFAASANYVINEWIDAKFDCYHPIKKNRPSVTGNVKASFVYLEYSFFIVISIVFATFISKAFLITIIWFLAMGIIYNVKPFRTKDRAFLDALSESVNNPIRLMLGWFIVVSKPLPPSSLVLSYWLGGAFLMGVKRFAEFRFLANPEIAQKYRRSFHFYNERNLLVSSFFYALSSAFFLGVFLIKYRIELLLSLPFFAVLYTWYLYIGFKPNSAAQTPEHLYRERGFLVYVLFLASVVTLLLFVNLPWLHWFLENAFISK